MLVLGFSGLAALSVGLGLNEFLSFRAQNLFLLAEYTYRRSQLVSRRVEELRAVVDSFELKGVARADAEQAVGLLAKYEDFFLEEVYLPIKSETLLTAPPHELNRVAPLVSEAFSTFLAVLVVGAIPLLGASVAHGRGHGTLGTYLVFYGMAGSILFTMGALKSGFYGVGWVSAGLATAMVGLACGGAGYVTGSFISSVVT